MVRCGRAALAWDGEAGGVDAFEATGVAGAGVEACAAADFAGAAGRRRCHSGLSELATSASAASPRTITTYLFRSGFIWDYVGQASRLSCSAGFQPALTGRMPVLRHRQGCPCHRQDACATFQQVT